MDRMTAPTALLIGAGAGLIAYAAAIALRNAVRRLLWRWITELEAAEADNEPTRLTHRKAN
jgi:hypothetical protein